jgi:hypothetical protein
MKMKSYLISLLLLVGLGVQANDNVAPDNIGMAVIHVNGSEIVKVVYKGETKNSVTLSVLDANGNLVYTESFAKTSGFIRPLNFEGLKYGEYTVVLEDTHGINKQRISYNQYVAKNDLDRMETKETVNTSIHIAQLKTGEKKFLVAVNNNVGGELIVKIYDNFDNLIHEELQTIKNTFAQVYDLKNVSGKIKIKVEGKNGSKAVASY